LEKSMREGLRARACVCVCCSGAFYDTSRPPLSSRAFRCNLGRKSARKSTVRQHLNFPAPDSRAARWRAHLARPVHGLALAFAVLALVVGLSATAGRKCARCLCPVLVFKFKRAASSVRHAQGVLFMLSSVSLGEPLKPLVPPAQQTGRTWGRSAQPRIRRGPAATSRSPSRLPNALASHSLPSAEWLCAGASTTTML
jgi:hypothetical protein